MGLDEREIYANSKFTQRLPTYFYFLGGVFLESVEPDRTLTLTRTPSVNVIIRMGSILITL